MKPNRTASLPLLNTFSNKGNTYAIHPQLKSLNSRIKNTYYKIKQSGFSLFLNKICLFPYYFMLVYTYFLCLLFNISITVYWEWISYTLYNYKPLLYIYMYNICFYDPSECLLMFTVDCPNEFIILYRCFLIFLCLCSKLFVVSKAMLKISCKTELCYLH